MREPGTPKNSEKIDSIERLATLFSSSFPLLTNVVYGTPGVEVSKTGKAYSAISGEVEGNVPNTEKPLKIKTTLFLWHESKHCVVHIRIGNVHDCVDLELQFEQQHNDETVVQSSVERSQEVAESVIPKGTGMYMYSMIPGLLTSFAKKTGKSYTHRIYRNSVMSQDKWMEVFGDFLKKYNYQYDDVQQYPGWVKSYT